MLSNLYATLQDAAIYIWRVQAENFRSAAVRRGRHHFCVLSAILVVANLGILVSTIKEVAGEKLGIESSNDSVLLRIFFTSTEVSQAVTQFQRFVVFWELAITIGDTAEEIAITPSESLGSKELASLCREIEIRCAFLSEKLSFPLSLMYTGYFVHLVTDIPVDSIQVGCEMSWLYFLSSNLKNLFELLIVVGAGNTLNERCRRLKREIRKRPEFLKDLSDEVKLFTRKQHTIDFGIRNRLTYESWTCFLGLSCGFTLTVFQNSFTPGGTKCPIP
jgi:hypothetical protein